MTKLRSTQSNTLDSNQDRQPSLGHLTAQLLLATALGGVALAGAAPQPA